MKKLQEFATIAIVSLPFLYLAYLWNGLPEQVPVHWNFQGEIDRYGSKMELLLIPILLPLLTYILISIVPYIDPKNKIANMGGKLQSFKLILCIFMSILAIWIIHSANNQAISNPNILAMLLGGLIIAIGNYLKTIKENYFIGIRTPWTLESPEVWKETHRLGGNLWFIGGLLIIISSLAFSQKLAFGILMGVVTIIAVVPIVYSYMLFRKNKTQSV